MASDIFISYRRHDASFFAARLRERIEQTFPGQVFLDVAGIEAGEDFDAKLRQVVASAKVVLAVVSPGWQRDREGGMRLGEPDDYVTREIATALEAGVAVIPVLIDGARMPPAQALPPRLQALSTLHGVSVTHERFESDAGALVNQLYRPLGIRAPGLVERLLDLLVFRGSFNQRSRDQSALWSTLAAAVAALLCGLWVVVDRADPLEAATPLLVAALALVLGWIGRNSRRWRRVATTSSIVSALLLAGVAGVGIWRASHLPRDPWIEANVAAQLHAEASEFPAAQVAWTTRALFYTPPPTVECGCLTARWPRDRSRVGPYPAGTRASYANECAGPVQFALSRSNSAWLASVYPWFAGAGREFAVVTLAPGQRVEVPLDGWHGHAMLPWVCLKEAAPSLR